jgi:competence protein ComEC
VPLALGLAVVGAAIVSRRPWLFCLAVLLLASGLSSRAAAGLTGPPDDSVEGWATLVSDPERVDDAERAEIRIEGAHLEIWARGDAAGALAPRLAGEQVWLRGSVRPVTHPNGYTKARHLAGVVQSPTIERWRSGWLVTRLANAYRRTVAGGARSIPEDARHLFTGFVVGDDREQDPLIEDDFRAAGLTHLLAVSGQNVAFLLAVAGPFLRRLELWPRLFAVVMLLAFFGLVTRFEPSVLRATAMAAIAVLGSTLGREASPVRVLALAVTALLLVDPMLVHAIGFRLSVGASVGILLLAPLIADRLPVPAIVREPLAVTIGAQVGVAPVLAPTFGGVPLVSIPANLLAGVAAGPIMAWGMTGGLLAGLAGEPIATIIHVPTRILVSYVAAVARAATALGCGELESTHLVALAAVTGVAWCARRAGKVRVLLVAYAAGILIAVTAAIWSPPPAARAQPTEGVTVWRGDRDGIVVVLDGDARVGRVLEALRRGRVRRVDVLVLDGSTARAVTAARAVARRLEPRVVLAPDGLVGGSVEPRPGDRIEVGGLIVEVGGVTRSPDIQVGSERAAGARAPPLRHHDAGRGDGHPQSHARLVLRQG